MPVTDAVELAKEISERIERRKKHLRENVEMYHRWIAEANENMAKVEAEIAEAYAKREEAIERLEARGYVPIKGWGTNLTLKVKLKQLTEVSRALGALDPATRSITPVDDPLRASRGWVTCTIKPRRYGDVHVVWEYKLKKTDKCKIVTVKRREIQCHTR